MKLSVFTVATPDLTPEELAAEAKQAGLDGIEWRYKEVPEDARGEKPSFWRNNLCSISPLEGDEHLDRFRQAAEGSGLRTLSVTPYLAAGDLEGTERVLDAARKLGARFIRLGVERYDRTSSFRELFRSQLAYLREAEPLCRSYGVKGLLETHHETISPSASAAFRLCEGFDPDWIGVLYDPGNLVKEGYENTRMGLELLGPYLAHVHVKNAGWRMAGQEEDGGEAWEPEWAPMNRGVVRWKLVMEDLRSVGYDGYLGLEDFSGEYDSRGMLRAFASYMRKLSNGGSGL